MTVVSRNPPGGDDFMWGAATSAYQIEGAVDEDGRGPSIWDTFAHTPGTVRGGDTGDVAVDSYHRWREDLDLAAALGVGAHRFSLAWPRIQPEGRGPANGRGLDHYDRVVDGLLERGIVPFPTLYHWDLPEALEDAGGWPARDTAGRFADYAELVHRRLGDRVRFWTTLNEPQVASMAGYAAGTHAPGRRDPAAALAAAHHLLLAHGLAMQAIRAGTGRADVGIVLNLVPARPADPDSDDVAVHDAVRRVDLATNRLFLDPVLLGRHDQELTGLFDAYGAGAVVREGDLATIGQPLDFLGVNYYCPHLVSAGGDGSHADLIGAADVRLHAPAPTTDMGWPIDAEALTALLLRLDRTYPAVPVYVTENGAAYDDPVGPDGIHDQRRIDYLEAHIAAVERAIAAGADVRGYFVWSLLDNFEWQHGYAMKFGIVHVHRDTLERTPKDSYAWYGAVIGRGGLG